MTPKLNSTGDFGTVVATLSSLVWRLYSVLAEPGAITPVGRASRMFEVHKDILCGQETRNIRALNQALNWFVLIIDPRSSTVLSTFSTLVC
jgi:hypothetical protein